MKTTGTVAWKLWVAYDNQRERGKLLRAALAIAICDRRRDEADVQALAAQLETALRATALPAHGKQKLSKRAAARMRRVLGKKAYRETPEMTVFGQTFGSHLSVWLRKSLDSGDFKGRIAAVDCDQVRTPDALVERFPDAFEEELFDESRATPFREQLTREMLLTEYVRQEMARRSRRRSARQATERAAASVAASGGVAYAAADALGAGDSKALVVGLAAAALGALAGGISWERKGAHAAEEARAVQPVLAWASRFLALVSGKRATSDPRALEAQLYAVLRDAVGGAPSLSPQLLAEAADQVADLRRDLIATEEQVLARELERLEEGLRNAAADPQLSRQALARLFAVIAACDLGPRGSE